MFLHIKFREKVIFFHSDFSEKVIFHKVVINRFVKNGSEMRIGNKPSKNTLTFAGGEGK